MSRIRTKTGGLPYARYQLERAILESAGESKYTTEDREAALKFFGGCAFCGAAKAPRNDHLVPVKKRGDFVRRNVVPACQECDDSKGQKEYREWMQSADSPKSLRNRGLTEKEIERRIQRIQKWQGGYEAKTEQQLFGKNYERYLGILKKMDGLCEEARQLIDEIKVQSRNTVAAHSAKPLVAEGGGTGAEKIRNFVVRDYISPARARGQKTVTIRSGDVHAQMQLSRQHRNVCQVLRGPMLREMANIKLLSERGPRAGGNTYFKYQL